MSRETKLRTICKCGANLTEMGAVEQEATELCQWKARVDEYGGLDFGSHETVDTVETYYTRCAVCEEPLRYEDDEEF